MNQLREALAHSGADREESIFDHRPWFIGGPWFVTSFAKAVSRALTRGPRLIPDGQALPCKIQVFRGQFWTKKYNFSVVEYPQIGRVEWKKHFGDGLSGLVWKLSNFATITEPDRCKAAYLDNAIHGDLPGFNSKISSAVRELLLEKSIAAIKTGNLIGDYAFVVSLLTRNYIPGHPLILRTFTALDHGWLPVGYSGDILDPTILVWDASVLTRPPKPARQHRPPVPVDPAWDWLPGSGIPASFGTHTPAGALGWVTEVHDHWEVGSQAMDFVIEHLAALGVLDREHDTEIEAGEGTADMLQTTWKDLRWSIRLSGDVKGIHPKAASFVAFHADRLGIDLYWIHPRGAPYQQAVLVPRSLESRYRSAEILGPKAKRVEPLPPNG